MKRYNIGMNIKSLKHIAFADRRMAWVWLIVRLYLGWTWLLAGWGKVMNPAWTGSDAGVAVKGFLAGALKKTGGEHPDVQWWYQSLIQNIGVPAAPFVSQLIAWGELVVGVALILGVLTGLAAFLGIFMNLNFLFAGTVSVNPQMLVLGLCLMFAWRIAGYYGVDRWLFARLHRNMS